MTGLFGRSSFAFASTARTRSSLGASMSSMWSENSASRLLCVVPSTYHRPFATSRAVVIGAGGGPCCVADLTAAGAARLPASASMLWLRMRTSALSQRSVRVVMRVGSCTPLTAAYSPNSACTAVSPIVGLSVIWTIRDGSFVLLLMPSVSVTVPIVTSTRRSPPCVRPFESFADGPSAARTSVSG